MDNDLNVKYKELISKVDQYNVYYMLSDGLVQKIKDEITLNKYKLVEPNILEIKDLIEPQL